MRELFTILLALFVFSTTSAHAAKLYKWVDKDGNVSYQDHPPPPNAGRVETRDLATTRSPEMKDGVAEKSPVVLYSIPRCQSCDLARAYLQKRKVPFVEKNVQGNPALQAEMKQKIGELMAPAILVGDKVIKNYVESWLESELDQAGYPKIEVTATPEASTQ